MSSGLADDWERPDYAKMMADGVQRRRVSHVRALRDALPPAPLTPAGDARWKRLVANFNAQAAAVLSGASPPHPDLDDAVWRPLDIKCAPDPIAWRADLYNAVGHEHSLAGLRLLVRPPRVGVGDGRSHYAVIVSGLSNLAHTPPAMDWSEALEMFVGEGCVHFLGTYRCDEEAPEIKLRHRNGLPHPWRVGAEIDLLGFDCEEHAKAHLAERKKDLERDWSFLRRIPEHRRAAPRRHGAEQMSDVDFMNAWRPREMLFNALPKEAAMVLLRTLHNDCEALLAASGLRRDMVFMRGELGLVLMASGDDYAAHDAGADALQVHHAHKFSTLAYAWMQAAERAFGLSARGAYAQWLADSELHECARRLSAVSGADHDAPAVMTGRLFERWIERRAGRIGIDCSGLCALCKLDDWGHAWPNAGGCGSLRSHPSPSDEEADFGGALLHAEMRRAGMVGGGA